MKNLLCAIFLLLAFGSYGQTQLEMNTEAANEYKKADAALNSVYKQVMKKYASDTAFTKNLKAAQRLWIQFRDAELKMKYPLASSEYGSIFPLCRSNYLTELTNARTATLQIWLDGIEEGDACAGSVGVKE